MGIMMLAALAMMRATVVAQTAAILAAAARVAVTEALGWVCTTWVDCGWSGYERRKSTSEVGVPTGMCQERSILVIDRLGYRPTCIKRRYRGIERYQIESESHHRPQQYITWPITKKRKGHENPKAEKGY